MMKVHRFHRRTVRLPQPCPNQSPKMTPPISPCAHVRAAALNHRSTEAIDHPANWTMSSTIASFTHHRGHCSGESGTP